jgi:hypothetical protein
MFDTLKEDDLVLARKSFYYKLVDSNFKVKSEKYKRAEAGCILLVLKNNFGHTFKNRFIIFLFKDKQIFFNTTGVNSILDVEECFELLVRQEEKS